MAKRKKKAGAVASRSESANKAEATPAAEGGPKGIIALVVALALVLGLAAFVTWHRRKDPARIWARHLETAHAQKIDARLTTCFGGSDGDAVRRVVNEVRHGSWGTSFRTCAGPRLLEVIAAPLDFLVDVGAPPTGADDAQARERGRIERLRGALQHLETATNGLDRSQPVPEDARDRVATALEDVAIEVQNERQSMEDLANVAESAASWW